MRKSTLLVLGMALLMWAVPAHAQKSPFRIVDYKIDNESASPRACFQFSEPLAFGKVDFAPFVTASGFATAAISTEAQQLWSKA